MTVEQPASGSHGDDELRRVYRAGARELPAAALDAAILGAARRTAQRSARVAFARRLAGPMAIAATVVLAVGVTLRVWEQEEAFTLQDQAPTVALSKRAEPAAAPMEGARPAAPAASPERRNAPRVRDDAAAAEEARASLKKREATPEEQVLTHSAPTPRERFAAAGTASGVRIAAEVTAVRASGQPGAYMFDVTVHSPDSGCEQYADWWEVVSADGKLLYRRVLLHSHADEQPFTRSGGPVPIQSDTRVWVRAHMNKQGYGGKAFYGSVATGFASKTPPPQFAAGLARQPPLPDGCAF